MLADYQKLCSKWKADSKPQHVYTPDRLHLPALDPELIRKSSASFSAATSTTLDALHSRSFSLLTNEALKVLATLLMACESLCVFPQQVSFLAFPLIPKPTGGHRPILGQAALVRLYESCRMDIVNAHADYIERDCGGLGLVDPQKPLHMRKPLK